MSKRIISEKIQLDNNTRSTQLNNNDLLIGTTGSGKTGSYVSPYLLTAQESFIVTDTKSNLCRTYRKYLEKRGYQVFLLDLTDPSEGCGYNPMQYIGKTVRNGKVHYKEKDILSIAAALCPVKNTKDPFWEMTSQSLIACLISYVLEEFHEKDHNLATVSDVFKLMVAGIHAKNVSFMEEHCLKNPDSFAARKFMMLQHSFDADRTWSCIEMFVSSALNVFDFDGAREMLQKPPAFRLEQLGRQKCALFLNVSDTDRCLDQIVNLLYTQAFQVLCREADAQPDSRLKMPVRILMDDFASNTRIPDFDKLISVIRSREISVSIILQNLSQLSSVYSDAQKWTIVNNCDSILYLGGTDMSTIYYIAERARKSPDEIMALELDKAYFIQRGLKSAVKIDKLKPYAMAKAAFAKERGEAEGVPL